MDSAAAVPLFGLFKGRGNDKDHCELSQPVLGNTCRPNFWGLRNAGKHTAHPQWFPPDNIEILYGSSCLSNWIWILLTQYQITGLTLIIAVEHPPCLFQMPQVELRCMQKEAEWLRGTLWVNDVMWLGRLWSSADPQVTIDKVKYWLQSKTALLLDSGSKRSNKCEFFHKKSQSQWKKMLKH